MATLIGVGLSSPDDVYWPWENIGGVFRFIETWWNNLDWWQRLLLGAGLVGMLWLYGLPLGLALGRAGYVAYAIGHTSAARDLAKDPAGSLGHYLLHRSPADMLADGLDFGLTFIPGFLGLKGTGGDLAGFVFGDMTVQGVGDIAAIDTSIAEGLAAQRQVSALGLDPSSVTMRPSVGGSPPGELPPPPVSSRGELLDTLPGEVVASRSDLAPNTAYDVPGRGTYYTDGSGTVVRVDQAPGGDIGLDIRTAKPGVEYVRDGFVYGVDDAGRLWMRPAP
jgi:hypothetical protein